MPKFLLEKDNQVLTLIVAFFILLVVIPGIVYINFQESTIKSEEGVLLENKKIFGIEINENFLFKQLPLLLSRTKEFQQMRSHSNQENVLLKKIKDTPELDDIIPKQVNKK